MQDRFKFRSYGRPNSIVEGMQKIYTFEENKNGYENVKVDKGWLAFVEKENLKIMQCTGLKDKNGKLIYEGDIVNGHCGVYWRKMLVIWDEISAAFYFKKLDKKGKLLPFVNDPAFVEIIGNRYETPELLERNNDKTTR